MPAPTTTDAATIKARVERAMAVAVTAEMDAVAREHRLLPLEWRFVTDEIDLALIGEPPSYLGEATRVTAVRQWANALHLARGISGEPRVLDYTGVTPRKDFVVVVKTPTDPDVLPLS
ncbi:hypothetical protein [Actinophytocola sp.]|uniref:hypothetical protein n=1 Tax=Actinophytocola sp. TaxID=1872138 RepID=UPI002ED080FE